MKVRLDAADLLPRPRDVLAALHVPPGAEVAPRLMDVVDDALTLLSESAVPVAVVEPLASEDFADLLRDGSLHAEDPVVGWIHARSEALALFAATLGPTVTEEIETLFAHDDYPQAVTLDAAASRMAENTTDALAARMLHELADDDEGRIRVLGYSPGYCGWHITGQRSLLARLRPEEIGITLGANYLMHPLKSVSGVLVAAAPEVHRFEPGFTYCGACRERTCMTRMGEPIPPWTTDQ